MASKEKNSKTIEVSLSQEEFGQLKTLAKLPGRMQDRSISWLVKDAVEAYIVTFGTEIVEYQSQHPAEAVVAPVGAQE